MARRLKKVSELSVKHKTIPVLVGYIYLTVNNNLSLYEPDITMDLKDQAFNEISTTGTRMSMMFD